MYIFGDFRPHPEDPISLEAFDQFDQTIAELNTELGIDTKDRFYALSPANGDKPAVTLIRNELLGEARSLLVGKRTLNFLQTVLARNDAGTKQNPNQVAAEFSSSDHSGWATEPSRLVGEQEFKELYTLVLERIQERSFVKEYLVPEFPSVWQNDTIHLQ